MKKIIFDCDLMKYADSGLYHYCLNLGLKIKERLAQNENDQIAFYVPPSVSNVFGKSSSVIVEKNTLRNTLKTFLWGCDIWHAPFQSGRIVPYTNKRIKVVLTIHDLNVLHEYKSKEEKRMGLAHTQKLIERADALVCISEFCKHDTLNHLDIGKKPLHVIYNGTNKLAIPLLTTFSYKPKKTFLFTLGYVNKKKNQHVLLPLLQNNDYELIIAGKLDDPDYTNVLQQSAKALGVEERVHLVGRITENEKAWYFTNCSAFLFPSIAEGFGLPIVEAMQCGKPLFISNKTSLPEIAGDAAFYFNSFEPACMQKVFLEGMQQFAIKDMSNLIKNRGMLYDWGKKADEYVKVYQSLY